MASQEIEENDNLLLWILVWSELVVFGALIGAFLIAFMTNEAGFTTGRQHLQPQIAGFNTVILLASGWQAAVAGNPMLSPGRKRLALICAAILGFIFAGVKIYEYSTEIAFATDAAYGVFFELYFMLTGFHLIHVVFVAFILLIVAWRLDPENVTIATTVWHVIDLIWIVLFPIIYLV